MKPATRRRQRAVLALLGPLAACASAELRLDDVEGHRHTPQHVDAGSVHVLVFTSHECPIANSYAPTLRELAAGWRELPVQVFLVQVDPDLTPAAARAHATAYELPGTVLLDPDRQLAASLGVTRTPEAVVLTATGLAYRGRIDDQWRGLGRRAPAAAQHDLRDAVAAVLAGQPVRGPFPPAVGCLLPDG
jgi:peroxiredoxin